MSKRKKRTPGRTIIDGVELIVLSPEDFERMNAHRRRAGAQATQTQMLRQQVRELTELLERLEQTLLNDPRDDDMAGAGSGDPASAHAAALALLRKRHGPPPD